MDISNVLIRIIILLMPGIVATKIYRKLRGKRAKKDWEDYTDVIIFSMFSYFIGSLIGSVSLTTPLLTIMFLSPTMNFFEIFIDDKLKINWNDVRNAVLISVFIAFIASYIYKHKLINRLGNTLRVSNRYGDEDVWDYLHNSNETEWVVVRDHKVNMYYYGRIQLFSETDEKREILLSFVSVYNTDGELCYETNTLYIARNFDDLTIELVKLESVSNENLNNHSQEIN
jgi:hypothetical protein